MAGEQDTLKDMKNTLGLFACVLIVVGVGWFLFHPESDDTDIVVDTVAEHGAIYANQNLGFETRVPEGFTVDESYDRGVAFRAPLSWSRGTNLSTDSYIAVERLVNSSCQASVFLDSPTVISRAVPGKNTFTVATEMGAAAGNRYEETVYMTEKGNQCYAIRSRMHSTAVENYPEGTVVAFDREAFRQAFDSIASTLIVY